MRKLSETSLSEDEEKYILGLQRWFCHLWFMVNLVFGLDVILLLALLELPSYI